MQANKRKLVLNPHTFAPMDEEEYKEYLEKEASMYRHNINWKPTPKGLVGSYQGFNLFYIKSEKNPYSDKEEDQYCLTNVQNGYTHVGSIDGLVNLASVYLDYGIK